MPVTSATQPKPTAVVEIERLGFSWTEVAQFDLTNLDVSRRIQVRETDHYAPKVMVDRYVIQMGESPFPPIIVTEDDWIVDGNTRVAARLERGEKHMPAYVLSVKVSSDRTPKKHINHLHMLAATLNNNGGKQLDANEQRRVVRTGLELDWNYENLARSLGVKSSIVSQVKKEMVAEARLDRVGMDMNGALKGAALRAIGAAPVQALNDVPFKEVAQLAADAGLNAAEIGAVAKEAKATGSDTGALEVIRGLRTESAERIAEVALTGSGQPPLPRQLRQHLGFISKFGGEERKLMETNPAMIEQHVAAVATSVAVLTVVLDLHKNWAEGNES